MTRPNRKSTPAITAVLAIILIAVLISVQYGAKRPQYRKLFSYGEETFSAPWSFSFSNDDRYYALIAEGTKVEIRTLPQNVLVQTYTYPEDNPPGSLVFAPNNQQIAIGTENEVDIWNLDNNQSPVAHLVDDKGAYSWGTVLFSPDNSQLVHNSFEILRIWDIDSGEIVARQSLPGDLLATNMAYSPDGKTLVINNGFVYIIDLEKKDFIRIDERVQNFAISADSNRLITTNYARVTQRRLADGSLINTFVTDRFSINIPIQPDLTQALSFSAEPTGEGFGHYRFYVSTWDIEEEKMLSKVEIYGMNSFAMDRYAVSPSGKYLAWLGIFGEVDLWQIKN